MHLRSPLFSASGGGRFPVCSSTGSNRDHLLQADLPGLNAPDVHSVLAYRHPAPGARPSSDVKDSQLVREIQKLLNRRTPWPKPLLHNEAASSLTRMRFARFRRIFRKRSLPKDRKSTRLNSSHSQISYAV